MLSNEDVQKWNVDEVSRFISSVTDIGLGDLFKKQVSRLKNLQQYRLYLPIDTIPVDFAGN